MHPSDDGSAPCCWMLSGSQEGDSLLAEAGGIHLEGGAGLGWSEEEARGYDGNRR